MLKSGMKDPFEDAPRAEKERRVTTPILVPRRAYTLGKRIQQARREKGLLEGRDVRQEEVAEACGVSGAAVSRWESDQKLPRDENVWRLADYLGVTPGWLRYGQEPKRPYSVMMADR